MYMYKYFSNVIHQNVHAKNNNELTAYISELGVCGSEIINTDIMNSQFFLG